MGTEVKHQDDHKDPEDPSSDGLARLEDVDDPLDGGVLGVAPDHRQSLADPAFVHSCPRFYTSFFVPASCPRFKLLFAIDDWPD